MEREAIEEMLGHVVFIRGDTGVVGTGFLLGETKDLKMVATARHVVVGLTPEPATIQHCLTGDSVRVGRGGTSDERSVFSANTDKSDASILIFRAPELPVPTVPIIERIEDVHVGMEVGWIGCPGFQLGHPCFFSGHISAALGRSYLVDGVAAPGVSGGPVFCRTDLGLRIVGSISAYKPGRKKLDDDSVVVLPGLSVANDVSFYKTVGLTERESESGDIVGTLTNLGPTKGVSKLSRLRS